MQTRHGCLIGIVAVALFGAYGTWVAGWGGDGAGTNLAVCLALGVIVIYVGSVIERMTTRAKRSASSDEENTPPSGES